MKLRQLQCLCALVDAGFNISRAANVLHATQPAVGKQLRQLEEVLGVDLLLRQGGRVVALTEAGERIVAWARRTLQCAQNIRAVALESGEEIGGSFTLATSHTHANYVLLPSIVAFTRHFPRVRINVLQGTPDQVAELVHDGKVAVGITHLPPDLPREIVAIPFATSPRVLITPRGHPLLKEQNLTLEKLAPYPMILLLSTRPQGARILRKFQEAGLQVNVVVQALDADVIKTYVGAGLGIGFIPAFSFSPERDSGLGMRPVHHLFDPAVSAVLLRRNSHLQPFVYAFLDKLDPTLERKRLEALVFEDCEL